MSTSVSLILQFESIRFVKWEKGSLVCCNISSELSYRSDTELEDSQSVSNLVAHFDVLQVFLSGGASKGVPYNLPIQLLRSPAPGPSARSAAREKPSRSGQ